MSASSALQKAIIAALKADAGVAAIVAGRVYDVPPQSAVQPYLSLGPTQTRTMRQDCFRRRVEVIQIDAWSGEQRQRQPIKALADAIITALDQADLSLDDPYGLGRLDLLLSLVQDDPDGITKHAVLQFEAEVTG